MKCPKCNGNLFFDETYSEESANDTFTMEWFTVCEKCDTEYRVREIYILTSQNIIDEIKED